ncbi:MAG: glycosyltransferase [Candidatus Eisenbacteria bacterium]|nr:glycosyltransferase [Candidatus Eisenbacteria bacterium]
MRILHVTPTYEPAYRFGGPIRSVAGLCRALARQGEDVHVYTSSSDGRRDLDVPVDIPTLRDGVKVTYFKCAFPRRIYRAPNMARRLRSAAERWDVIHAHSVFLWPTLTAASIARRRDIPYLVSPRGMLEKDLIRQKSRWLKTAWIGLFERNNLANASAVHVTSIREAEELRRFGWPLRAVEVIPNGVDAFSAPGTGPGQRFKELGLTQRPFVLYLGRIHWKKGLDRLIDAMNLVPDADLVMAGNDEEGYRALLERRIAELGLEGRVRWVGPVEGEMKRCCLAASSMVALCSYSENFGNTVLEAMSASKAVVVTPEVGLAPEVERGGAGLVCEGRPEALAAGIQRLLQDPILAASYGERGRALAGEYFDWESVARRMRTLYDRILSEKRHR